MIENVPDPRSLKVRVEAKVEFLKCRAVGDLEGVDEADYRLALPSTIEGFYPVLNVVQLRGVAPDSGHVLNWEEWRIELHYV